MSPSQPDNPTQPSVIGIILTYNCAHLLENTYARLNKTAYTRLILIDDGSHDEIAVVAKKLELECYIHPHLGYGGNLKFGLRKALEFGAEYVVEVHGDGQYASTNVAQGISKMQVEKIDFLLGSRFAMTWNQPLKDGISYIRYFANIGLSFIDRLTLCLPLTEFHSGFRIYTRRLLETVGFEHTANDYVYSFEIIAQAKYFGFSVAEMPVRCDYLERHTSIDLNKSTVYALQTLRVLGEYLYSTWLGRPTKLFRER